MPDLRTLGAKTPSPFGNHGRSGLSPYLGFAPGGLLFVVFFLAPAIAIGYFALTDATGVSGLPIHFVGLSNFRQFFDGGARSQNMAIIERSLIYAAVVTVVQNTLGLALALVLNGRIRYRSLVRTVVFAPVVLGVTVTGLVWTLILDPTAGPVSSILSTFGVHSALLGAQGIAFWLVIGVQIWTGLGYSMVIFLAGLQTVPGELLEAVTIDGAGAWRRFTSITWPLLAPSVTTNVLIAIIGSLQSYQLVYVLTDGLNNTSVLGFAVFSQGFGSTQGTGTLTQTFSQQGYAASISVVQFVITAVLALIVLGFLRRREVTT